MINLFLKITRRIVFLFYLFKITNFKGLSFSSKSDIIIWIPIFSWKYLIRDRILLDFAKINSLSILGKKFNVLLSKKIGNFNSKIIFTSYDFEHNIFSFSNYTKQLYWTIKQLENQNNIVYPTSSEYLYWENKAFMHKQFESLKVSHPKSKIIKPYDNFLKYNLNYPFLIKEVHSCQSNGVYKIENASQLEKLNFKNDIYIFQKLLNIRRDLRVTIIGDEIVHFYWRINNSKDWRPTSTGHGSSVDFVNFPEKWRNFIINEFKKLDLVTGALDIAWENDDLNNEPLILEVSPTYQLNPLTKNPKYLSKYNLYKKYSIFGKNSYLFQYIKQTFDVENLITEKRF